MLDILIIASDGAFRRNLQLLLEGTEEYRVTEAQTIEEALLPASAGSFRLVILDEVREWSPADAVRKVRSVLPESEILVVAGTDSEADIFEALKAGAAGYVGKKVPPLRLLAAIEEVKAGGAPMSKAAARKILLEFQESPAEESPSEVVSPLSRRESEILGLLYRGFNYRDIAEQLFISFSTVHSHVKNIYTKLQVNSRSEAIYAALQKKLLR